MATAGQRIAYFNGRFVPESQVLVPFRDRGFKYGDAVFDTTRTFGHRVFKLAEHVDPLYRPLRYLRIDPGIAPAELVAITEEVLRQNLVLLGPDEDYWVSQRISRGLDAAAREVWPQTGATVIVECLPLPLRDRASLYRDGIRVVTPAVRRTAPEAMSPRAKTHNYLNVVLGDLEAKSRDPEAWAVLLDTNGHLAEGIGSNIFLVRDGVIRTPREDLDLFDAYGADEAFLTSTSLCICPVQSVNGIAPRSGAVPGPVTRQLTDAYRRFVDYDFVAQYLKHLDG